MATKMGKSTGKASPEITDNLAKIVMIVTKVMEVMHWIGAAVVAVLVTFALINGEWLKSAVRMDEQFSTMDVYGFSVEVVKDGVVNHAALGWFAVGVVLILCVMAMVFRNVYLITKNSQDSTPFQPDNVRMLKELGIFFIMVPVVGTIFEMIISLVANAEVSVNSDGVLVGLIMLYLTQLFAHGVTLEDNVKKLKKSSK